MPILPNWNGERRWFLRHAINNRTSTIPAWIQWHNHSHSHPFLCLWRCVFILLSMSSLLLLQAHTIFMTTTQTVHANKLRMRMFNFCKHNFRPFPFCQRSCPSVFVKAIFTIWTVYGQLTHNYKRIDFMFLSSSGHGRSCFWLKSAIFSVQHTAHKQSHGSYVMAMRIIAIDFSMHVWVSWLRNLCSVFSLNESNL